MKINTDKIIKELSKGDIVEQIDAYNAIREFITNSLLENQKKKEEEANNLQSILDRINGA